MSKAGNKILSCTCTVDVCYGKGIYMEGTQGSNFLVDSKCAVNSIDYSDPDAKLCIFGLYGDAGGWTCTDNNQRYQPGVNVLKVSKIWTSYISTKNIFRLQILWIVL